MRQERKGYSSGSPAKGFISQGLMDEISRGSRIEITGRLWAQRHAERMRAHLDKSVLIMRKGEGYEEILELVTLTGEEGLVWNSVWFDDTGNLHMSRWPTAKTKETGGVKALINPSNREYVVLNRKSVRSDFFDSLPHNIPIRELVIDTVKTGIETAIRKARHITKRTKEEEVEIARRVVRRSDDLAYRFITDGTAKENLQDLGRETVHMLEEVGLIEPQDPDKQNMNRNLRNVTLNDALGRYNPLVSRVRARAAYLSAMRRIVVGGMVVRKFAAIEQILIYERETTRWAIETAKDQLSSVLRLTDSSRPEATPEPALRSSIANILIDISKNHLALPRVKPYLAPARFAAINLVGCRDHQVAANRKILGDQPMTDILFDRIPTRSLVMQGRFSEASSRISESIITLEWVLRRYASIEKQKTS